MCRAYSKTNCCTVWYEYLVFLGLLYQVPGPSSIFSRTYSMYRANKSILYAIGHVIDGCSQYWIPDRQSTVTDNLSCKIYTKTQKWNANCLCQLATQWHWLGSWSLLAEAASSCCQSTVESGSSSWHFFVFKYIMANMMKNIVNAFDGLC